MKIDGQITRRRLLSAGAWAAFGSTAVASVAEGRTHLPASSATPSQIEGPFYRPGAPFRKKLRLDDPEGDVLVVQGTVQSAADRTPLAGAVLDVWQCNHRGHYDNEAPGYDPARFLLRGKIRTDAGGRYDFETVIPANYPLGPDTPQLRARHIHFRVFAEGHAPLTTQLYFDDDPYLDLDPISDDRLAVPLRRMSAR